MKNLVVVGYPKSGCTWVTRLLAELIGCPVAGFWHSEKSEIAVEGAERISDYRCHKSHHQYHELALGLEDRAVYVLRDPRDIAVSAASHFIFRRFGKYRTWERAAWARKLYAHTLYPLLVRQNARLEKMTGALLAGDARVHNWVRVSWQGHLRPYAAAGVPLVRYEDLLAAPETEARILLQKLGIARSPEEIATAVREQSFERKKAALLARGERGQAKFLRSGHSGKWREKLPPHLQTRFTRELGDELTRWGYDPA